MNEIKLIANSGIQFITYRVNLGQKTAAMKVSSEFAEMPETIDGEEEVFLRHPYYHSKINQYIRFDEINKNAIDPLDGSVDEDKIDADFISVIKNDYINSINAREALACFENSWIPVPFLRYTTYEEQGIDRIEFQDGPCAWARMFITAIPEVDLVGEFTHYIILSFDTTCRLDEDNDEEWWLPKLSKEFDRFFNYKCDYRDENLTFIERNQSLIRNIFDSKPEFRDEELYLKEFQLFLTLLSVLQKANWKDENSELKTFFGFPQVSLHDPNEEDVEVALVLDVGNSRTCGILSEISDEHSPYDITKAVPLEIRDFSKPYSVYFKPFEMQVAMVKPPFLAHDEVYNGPFPFSWPSICRVGPESVRYATIYSGTQSNSLLSSPKRYLWDLKEWADGWEYLAQDENGVELAIDEFLTPELSTDGRNLKKEEEKRIYDEDNIAQPALDRANFSRSSLMKLALVEIFQHAITQINSTQFRNLSSKKIVRRRLSKIVLTCPTAMPRTERFILRDHADSAIELLKDICNYDDYGPIAPEVKIVPSPSEIHKPTANRKSETWEYDEATCSQIAFLYSEIKDRFKDPKLFIKHLGRKRANAQFIDRPALTVASIDIGGGTTDVMIASYQTHPESDSVIVPKPLFWESFNLAGDHILKSIIERLVLPQIQDFAKSKNHGSTLTNAILELFGTYTGHQRSSDIRTLKRHIVSQVLLPIASEALEFARTGRGFTLLRFDDIYRKYDAPNPNIIKYINDTFIKYGVSDFDIKEVSYEFSIESINNAILEVLKITLPQLSSIIAQFHCDFVLLAGRPTNLPVVRDLLLQYLPATPDKIIQLGNYWMGEWYPFIKTAGYIHDPKTCVSVGALIALLSGEMGKLNDFSIDLSALSQVESTADFIGKYNRPHVQKFHTEGQEEVYMDRYEKSFTIDFFDYERLGMKQLDHDSWIGTKMYEIQKVSRVFERYKNLQPFKLELVRQNPLNVEEITLKRITDKNGKSVDVGALQMEMNTLDDEYGYWLDTGIFNVELFGERNNGDK